MKTLDLWLSGAYDQLNGPNLSCLEEIKRRVCQLVEAYDSGAHRKPNWASVKWFTSVQSSSNIVPVSMRSFAFRKVKEEVETETLRLRATKTVPVFEDGEWESPAAPDLLVAKSKSKGKGKERKGPRQLTAAAARPVLSNPPTALAPSGRPRSNIGFRSSTLSLRFQRWFRLMSLEIPVLVYVSGCAEGNAKNVTSHAVLNL